MYRHGYCISKIQEIDGMQKKVPQNNAVRDKNLSFFIYLQKYSFFNETNFTFILLFVHFCIIIMQNTSSDCDVPDRQGF